MRMGCIQEGSNVNSDMLKTQLRKIKYSVEILKQKLENQKKKGDQILYSQVLKPFKQRSRQLERVIIIGNAKYQNQKNIYSHIENQTNILLEHANLLDSQSRLTHIRNQLNTLRYCSQYMDCEELKHFQHMFQSLYPRYPFPTEEQITNYLLKYQKRQQVAFKDELQYIFQFSSSYQVPIQRINEVGHNYHYGAEKYE